MRYKWLSLLLAFLCSGSLLKAQLPADTLRIGLPEAEKMFLDSNFQLLAQRYNIDAGKAQIMQAKLWPNPNFSISHGLYSGALGKFFPTGVNDETAAGLSQLIVLAGKRNKQVKIAQANAILNEYEFFDLMRTLKYTLRTDFFKIYYLQRSSGVYTEEIRSLEQVTRAFAEQQGKGYISEKEVIRIKAQLYSLQNEYSDLLNQLNDVQGEIRLLLQVRPTVFLDPRPDTASILSLDPSRYTLTTLIDSAYLNRADLRIAKKNTELSKLNYNYQRSLAVPDLTLSLGYDEQGSFLTNYYGLGAAIDLPFFNRNQGNIASAKAMIGFNNATQKSVQATVEENVTRALQKAFAQHKLFQSIDPGFAHDFERMQHEVLINYQKRNINLLDFLDFYDSYKGNILQFNTVQFNRLSAFEDINFYTGTNFFN